MIALLFRHTTHFPQCALTTSEEKMQDEPDSAVPVRPVPAQADASGVSARFVLSPLINPSLLSWICRFPLVRHKWFHLPLLHEAEELENPSSPASRRLRKC